MSTTHTRITRYIIDKNLISVQRKELKPGAFLPRPGETGRLETSVGGINELSEDEIWDMGKKCVLSMHPSPRSLKGRADMASSEVMETGLDFADDLRWEGRHSNIVNWSLEQETQLEQAMDLVRVSQFMLYGKQV